jgi:hypothetical protein
MKDSLEDKTIAGWEPCPEHVKLYEEGFIALIEAEIPEDPTVALKNEDAVRLGRIFHLRESAFNEFLNLPSRNDEGKMLLMVFIEPEVADLLMQGYEKLNA